MFRTGKLIVSSLLLCVGCLSCKKFLQVGPPKDELSANAVFLNDSTAQEAITGLYINIMSNNRSLLNGGMTIYPALSADELTRSLSVSNDDQFVKNALTPDNLIITYNYWESGYSLIYQTNICIENLSNSTLINEPIKLQLLGEAKFIRALCYWYLVNLFGDVPLITSTNKDVNSVMPRAPTVNIYQQIISDLEDASHLLADKGANTRPGKQAAAALLARAYCYQRQWNKAETLSSSIINAGSYRLVDDLNNVFLATSSETILQFAPVLSNISTAEGLSFVPPTNGIRPNYVLTDMLLASFEPNDRRISNWTKSVVINGQTYCDPYKYKINGATVPNTECNVVIRLSEQYLIRAEAEAENGKLNEAIADINTIRTRAGLDPISNTIGLDSCLSIIAQERRKEFFVEWGHRWFDLKRSNRIDAELKIIKGDDWQPFDQLYPIPLTEIQINPSLVQNPGY
jgi:hypothetical protein